VYIASYAGNGLRHVWKVSDGIFTSIASGLSARALAVDGAGNLYIGTDFNAIYEFSGRRP
jgi:hypothetical protein